MVLVSVSLILPVPLPAGLLIPVTVALVQVIEAPGVLLVAVYVNAVPLHAPDGDKELVKAGGGFTLRTTFCILLQPAAEVVNTYVTLIGAVVVFVSASLIAVVPVARPHVAEGDARPGQLSPVTAARLHANVAPTVVLVAV